MSPCGVRGHCCELCAALFHGRANWEMEFGVWKRAVDTCPCREVSVGEAPDIGRR